MRNQFLEKIRSKTDTSVSIEEGSSHSIAAPVWRTTWIRYGPLWGIFCLLLAILSILAAGVVLVVSNNAPTAGWRFQPSTYLAAFTAIANQGMQHACLQGVAIAWWTAAIQGTTLAELHQRWEQGVSLRAAVMSGRRIGIAGLACILCSLVVIDGPLLQKASTVKAVPRFDSPLTLNVSMVPEMPRNWSGLRWYGTGDGIYGSHFGPLNGTGSNNVVSRATLGRRGMEHLSNPFLLNEPVRTAVSGCTGECTMTLRAPALKKLSCTKRSMDVNYQHLFSARTADIVPLDRYSFFVDISLGIKGPQETIEIVTGHAVVPECVGELFYTTCSLVSAVGEYDVPVRDDILSLDHVEPPRIIAVANNSAPPDAGGSPNISFSGNAPSTLAGVVDLATRKYANAWLYFQSLPAPRLANGKKSVNVFGTFGGELAYTYHERTHEPAGRMCGAWRDPMDDVIRDLNNLMFRSGAHVAQNFHHLVAVGSQDAQNLFDPGMHASHSVTGKLLGLHNIFESDYWWFLGAAIVELVCIMLVLPTYMGWWRLGRPVSFSPLEIAKVRCPTN